MFPLTIGIIVFGVALLITFGASRDWPRTKSRPGVTVVICARDEEKYLMDCLMSLSTQDYPNDKYSIILVDHLSKDGTGELMDYYASYSPVPTRVIHITEEDPVLKGKVHALDVGLSQVETEYVLLTDGDCIVPETWISTLMAHFTESMLAVGGFVTVGRLGTQDTAVARLQHVDHRYYLGMLCGLAGLRAPGSKHPHVRDSLPPFVRRIVSRMRPAFCIGNNLAFRMSVYREIGGYRAVGPSLVEDYALMNALSRRSKKHLAIIKDPGARVITTPEKDLHSLWRQKRRWGTATGILNPLSVLLFTLIILIRTVIPWFLFIHPIEASLALLLMTIGDILVISLVSHGTMDKVRWQDILFHEIYQIVLNTLLVLANMIRWPVVWKGQRYPNRSHTKSA